MSRKNVNLQTRSSQCFTVTSEVDYSKGNTDTPVLSLESFLYEMMGVFPSEIAFEQFKVNVGRLNLNYALLKEQIQFCDYRYSYKVICQTLCFEILVCGWKPGQASTVHDHAGALTAVRVIDGELTSRLFEMRHHETERKLVRVKEEKLEKGALTFVGKDGIHQLINKSSENAVSLHIYSRPIEGLTIYWPGSDDSEQVAVRYKISN